MKNRAATAKQLAEIAGVDVSTVFVTARMLREALKDVPGSIDHVDQAQKDGRAVNSEVRALVVAK